MKLWVLQGRHCSAGVEEKEEHGADLYKDGIGGVRELGEVRH